MTTDITPPPTRDPPYEIPPRRPSVRVRAQWPELSTFAPTPHHRGHLGRSCRCSHPPSTMLHPHATARVQRRSHRIMLGSGAAKGASPRSVSMHLQFPRDDAARSATEGVRSRSIPTRPARDRDVSDQWKILVSLLERFFMRPWQTQASGLCCQRSFASRFFASRKGSPSYSTLSLDMPRSHAKQILVLWYCVFCESRNPWAPQCLVPLDAGRIQEFCGEDWCASPA